MVQTIAGIAYAQYTPTVRAYIRGITRSLVVPHTPLKIATGLQHNCSRTLMNPVEWELLRFVGLYPNQLIKHLYCCPFNIQIR